MKKTNVYTASKINELKELVNGLPRAEGVKLLKQKEKLSPRQSRRIYAKYLSVPGFVKETPKVNTKLQDENKLDVGVTTSEKKSLQEVLELCNVDTAQWKVKTFSVNELSNHQFVWRVSFQKVTNDVGDINQLIEAFNENAKQHSPKEFKLNKSNKDGKYIYVLNIQDLHFAKLAWSKETGGRDFDLAISKKDYREAISDLMAKAPVANIEKVVLVVGSDMFHTDTMDNTTTAGTRVDTDTRWAKAFSEGAALIVEVIEELASDFEVEAVVIPGNHDEAKSYYLGCYLSAWFNKHENVIISNSPQSRKYVEYGNTLIGFSHGSEERLEDLPLIVMREKQNVISNFKYIEVLTGHLHQEKVKEIKGIKIRTAPALCPPDKWHSKKGYIGNIETSQGLLYSKENGLEAIFYSKPIE